MDLVVLDQDIDTSTGGQKPKLGARQARMAQRMYDETDDNGGTTTPSPRSPRSSASPDPTIYRYRDQQVEPLKPSTG